MKSPEKKSYDIPRLTSFGSLTELTNEFIPFGELESCTPSTC